MHYSDIRHMQYSDITEPSPFGTRNSLHKLGHFVVWWSMCRLLESLGHISRCGTYSASYQLHTWCAINDALSWLCLAGFICITGIGAITWRRHQMETFSALLVICAGNSSVTGDFPSQRPVTRSFDAFFDRGLNKRFCKQSRRWWFETPSRSLWRHYNHMTVDYPVHWIDVQKWTHMRLEKIIEVSCLAVNF